MVAYSVVSLPLCGSVQLTSTSCAWLMSTWWQKWAMRSLCIDPFLFPKFPLLASAPTSAWSAPSRTAQWANSCTAVADNLPVLQSWRGFVHKAKQTGFHTLLPRVYGCSFPCLSAIPLISLQLVPWDLLPRTQSKQVPTLLTRIGQKPQAKAKPFGKDLKAVRQKTRRNTFCNYGWRWKLFSDYGSL